MYSPYELGTNFPKSVATVGQRYRSGTGFHIHQDLPQFFHARNYPTYYGAPVTPFLGMRFAILAHYDKDYKLFHVGLGKRNDGATVEIYHYDSTFGLAIWDYTINNGPKDKTARREIGLNDYIWFEIRIDEYNRISGCVDGETLVTSDYNAEDMIKQLRIKREICYGTFREHYCTTREMHFTSLDETRRPFIFEEPRIPGRFHYGLEYIFVYSSGCYIREGGSIAMTGRNTESTDPATAGIFLGIAADDGKDQVHIHLKTALDKKNNFIMLRKGHGEVVFYCNDEYQTAVRPRDRADYLVIVGNFLPTNVVVHTGRFEAKPMVY